MLCLVNNITNQEQLSEDNVSFLTQTLKKERAAVDKTLTRKRVRQHLPMYLLAFLTISCFFAALFVPDSKFLWFVTLAETILLIMEGKTVSRMDALPLHKNHLYSDDEVKDISRSLEVILKISLRLTNKDGATYPVYRKSLIKYFDHGEFTVYDIHRIFQHTKFQLIESKDGKTDEERLNLIQTELAQKAKDEQNKS